MTSAHPSTRVALVMLAAALWPLHGCGEPTSPRTDPPPTSYVHEGVLRFTVSAEFEPEHPHPSGDPTPLIRGELTVENVTDERVVRSFGMCINDGRIYREGSWVEPIYAANPSGCTTGEVLVDLEPGESVTPGHWLRGFDPRDPPDGLGLGPGLYRVAMELTAKPFLPRDASQDGPVIAAPEPVEVPADAVE